MKHAWGLVLSLILVFAVSGCTGQDAAQEETREQVADTFETVSEMQKEMGVEASDVIGSCNVPQTLFGEALSSNAALTKPYKYTKVDGTVITYASTGSILTYGTDMLQIVNFNSVDDFNSFKTTFLSELEENGMTLSRDDVTGGEVVSYSYQGAGAAFGFLDEGTLIAPIVAGKSESELAEEVKSIVSTNC